MLWEKLRKFLLRIFFGNGSDEAIDLLFVVFAVRVLTM